MTCFKPLSSEWARTVALSLCGSVLSPRPPACSRHRAERQKIIFLLRPTPATTHVLLLICVAPLWAGERQRMCSREFFKKVEAQPSVGALSRESGSQNSSPRAEMGWQKLGWAGAGLTTHQMGSAQATTASTACSKGDLGLNSCSTTWTNNSISESPSLET